MKMLDHCKETVQSLFYGCLVCLVVTSVVNADGRVFVLDLRNSSGLQGFRDAEQACASRHARLASSAEVHHAVVECFFSTCTRGWLYGGTVGTTVCNIVGSALKAVDVKTENATEDAAHLDAFCIKDKGVPCGDPPSFPNARLQGHSGYEMGDELLYTCVPGYVMPSGHSAFSLLCDSCGEWYGLVELCVKDETESHVDYEDKFTDTYGEAERHSQRPEEAYGEVHKEVHGGAYPEEKSSQEQQETSFGVEVEEEHQDQHGEPDVGGEVIGRKHDIEEEEKEEQRAAEHYIGHPTWGQERREVVTTEAPVSLLSQKHLFWFPSEAFQDEGHPVSTNPATQTTQRASGAQSEESKEHESQERHHHQHPVDHHDQEPDSYDDHDRDDQYDHDHSNHDDLDAYDDSRHDDQDDHDSHQDEEDHDDHGKHYIPAEPDSLDRHESHENHDDHYDMGEHEEDRDRRRYGSQEYDDRDDTYDDRDSYEDHEDVTDDHGEDDQEHPDVSKEHPENDDDEEHYDTEEDDRYKDHDDHDHDDHDHEDHDHVDHEHDDHDSYDDHDSHEDVDDGQQHVIFSIAADDHQNVTQKGEGEEATTDETWLDGYPVVPKETDNGGSTNQRVRPEDRERGAAARTTDKPNEVEIRRPVPYTSLPEAPEPASIEPVLEQEGVDEMWPGFIPTSVPSAEHSQPSDSPSYLDTLDFDTQQVAPTRSWLEDLTEDPFLHHDPAPPVHDGDILMEEHTVHNLPSETGERGEMEGEMGETICTGENCPPAGSSSRGPTVAAIIVVVCVVAAAVIVGLWCYRRQQQKSSMYEMNGKGQSQTRQGQQIEMQQKV